MKNSCNDGRRPASSSKMQQPTNTSLASKRRNRDRFWSSNIGALLLLCMCSRRCVSRASVGEKWSAARGCPISSAGFAASAEAFVAEKTVREGHNWALRWESERAGNVLTAHRVRSRRENRGGRRRSVNRTIDARTFVKN